MCDVVRGELTMYPQLIVTNYMSYTFVIRLHNFWGEIEDKKHTLMQNFAMQRFMKVTRCVSLVYHIRANCEET